MIRVALALVALGGVAHADMDAADVLKRIESTYQKPTTLIASFEQSVTNAVGGPPTKTTGTLTVAKPDKIRFATVNKKDGKPRVTSLFDGKTGYYIDHGGTQYWKQDATKSDLPAMLTFFFGADRLSKEFTPSFAASGVRTGNEILLVLTPVKTNAASSKIMLAVDNKGFRVDKVTITNSSGTTQELVFSNVQIDKPVPANTFVPDKKQLAGYNEIKKP